MEELLKEVFSYVPCRDYVTGTSSLEGRWQGPAAYTKEIPVLSSEKAPQKNRTVTKIYKV
jgi:hypothetical protein